MTALVSHRRTNSVGVAPTLAEAAAPRPVGETVRVWRLYLVGGALAFREGRMGVDQILCVRPGSPHTLPLERHW